MSFPRYLEYKDSGVEWLGSVPKHWEVSPIKYLATHNDDVLDDNTSPDTEIVYVDISSVDGVSGITSTEVMKFLEAPSRARRRVRHGDVIISTVRTYLRAIATIKQPKPNLIVSTGFAVIRPGKSLAPDFLGYLLSANGFLDQVVARSAGVSYPAINASELVAIKVSLPPTILEQTQIVEFLDRETAKIDALVAEQRRLVELLKEKRQAVIVRAVTKGLNLRAPMKSSGLEWLGDVPEHWEVWRSRRLFSIRDEPAKESDVQLTASQRHGVIPQSEFMELEGQRVVQVIKGTDILKHVEPNDFVISMRSFQGGIEWCKSRGRISSAYVILIPGKKVHTPFFIYLLKSSLYIQALQTTSNLVRDGQALRFENFSQVDLPLPPEDEQAAIAKFLDAETSRFDALVFEASIAINRLIERRSALISDAVTGQIDVRQVTEEVPA